MKYKVIKVALAGVGKMLPEGFFHFLNGVYNYLHIGWWFQNRKLEPEPVVEDRPELYAQVSSEISEPVTYLEFGVFRGASMRIWSSLLKDRNSKLFGFDSFEGLPETWRSAADTDTFNVKGEIPKIDDDRVNFIRGWFDDTLPEFLEGNPIEGNLIVHFDADLYSSTKTIMSLLKNRLESGVIIVFDELFDRDHELRALDELIEEEGLVLECIGVTKGMTQAAFRIK